MKEPMDLMMSTATQNAGILSSNKALEETEECTKQIEQFLRRLVTANEADATRVSDLMNICEVVNAAVSDGVLLVKHTLRIKMELFKTDLKTKAIQGLEAFNTGISELVRSDGVWEFKTKEDADAKVAETLKNINLAFSLNLDAVLEDKQKDLQELMDDLRESTRKNIFTHLQRISDEVHESDEDFNPDITKVSVQLDTTSLGYNANVVTSQERSTSIKTKLSSLLHLKMFTHQNEAFLVDYDQNEAFLVDYEVVKSAAIEQLSEYTLNMVKNACMTVEKSVLRVVDGFFLQGLKKVAQLREALSERERLRGDGLQVKRLHESFQQAQDKITLLLKDIQTKKD